MNNQNYKNKLVYVLNINGQPLMPCRIIKARHLLKSKKAKIVKYEPFTIQLLFECENKVQDITLGADPAGRRGGLSARTDKQELYSAEFEVRTDIVKLISTRRWLRRGRRNRKTRYRKCRFLNRKRKDNWLPPSIMSKLNSHLQLIKKVRDILPVSKVIVEVASFDIQKIKNSKIQGIEYRQGEQLGFENVKEYVKFRDSYRCQALKSCRNKDLEVHHLESRMTGGNAPNNFLTLCKIHHQEVTDGKRELKVKRGESYRHSSYLNMMRLELVKRLREVYKEVGETYGYITKLVRKDHKLEKSHRNDALCISGNPNVERLENYYQIKQVRKKKRNLHEADPRKGGVRKNYNTKQITKKDRLWTLWDKVKLENKMGFISGFSRNSVYIRDIENKSLQQSPTHRKVNPNKLELINRNNNWIYGKE